MAKLDYIKAVQVAQEKNGNDRAERDVEVMEHLTGLVHDQTEANRGRLHEIMMQKDQQEHDKDLAQTPPPVDPNAQQPQTPQEQP